MAIIIRITDVPGGVEFDTQRQKSTTANEADIADMLVKHGCKAISTPLTLKELQRMGVAPKAAGNR